MTLKQALATKLAEVGIILVEMEVTGGMLNAFVDESLADEPLCPLAFDRVVGALSWSELGVRLTGRFAVAEPALRPAPLPAATSAAPTTRRAA